MSARRTLAKLRSSADRRVVFEAAFLLPVVSLALRTIGLVRVRRLLDRKPSQNPRRSVNEAQHLALLVEAVARRSPLQHTCLQRSVVLCRVLRHRELEAELRLGVRKETAGDRQFHAWVEHAGRVLNDDQHVRDRYSSFGTERGGSEHPL
jgi:transglutaminase superfamily protein